MGRNTHVFSSQDVTEELRAKIDAHMPGGLTRYDVGYAYHFKRQMEALWEEQNLEEEIARSIRTW